MRPLTDPQTLVCVSLRESLAIPARTAAYEGLRTMALHLGWVFLGGQMHGMCVAVDLLVPAALREDLHAAAHAVLAAAGPHAGIDRARLTIQFYPSGVPQAKPHAPQPDPDVLVLRITHRAAAPPATTVRHAIIRHLGWPVLDERADPAGITLFLIIPVAQQLAARVQLALNSALVAAGADPAQVHHRLLDWNDARGELQLVPAPVAAAPGAVYARLDIAPRTASQTERQPTLAAQLRTTLASVGWREVGRVSRRTGVVDVLQAAHHDALRASHELAAARMTLGEAASRITARVITEAEADALLTRSDPAPGDLPAADAGDPAVQEALHQLLADGEAWERGAHAPIRTPHGTPAEDGAAGWEEVSAEGHMLDDGRYWVTYEPLSARVLLAEWGTDRQVSLTRTATRDLLRWLQRRP